MNKESQMFRFCLRCVRMTLVKNNCCNFCKGKFLVTSHKDDLKLMPRKKLEEAY